MTDRGEVAFFGGSFNPPHVSHVLAAAYLRAVIGFERVLVVPVYAHAFDKPLTSYEHRVRMCELAMRSIEGVEVSQIERDLEVPSLTLRTLQAVVRARPGVRLRLVIGADLLSETGKWHAFDEVRRIAPPFVLGRAGFEPAGAPPPVLPEISSTRVRELLADRQDPERRRELSLYVPAPVLDYIDEHDLYRG